MGSESQLRSQIGSTDKIVQKERGFWQCSTARSTPILFRSLVSTRGRKASTLRVSLWAQYRNVLVLVVATYGPPRHSQRSPLKLDVIVNGGGRRANQRTPAVTLSIYATKTRHFLEKHDAEA